MKGFLLDENLPYRLRIQSVLPIQHSKDIGPSPSDDELWEYAGKNELAIVTKDADFSDRILISDPPPWIVHLRIGNLRLAEFHALMERTWPRIEALLPDQKLINIYLDRIEAVS